MAAISDAMKIDSLDHYSMTNPTVPDITNSTTLRLTLPAKHGKEVHVHYI